MITITVSGPAGSGKSAIAQTLARVLEVLDVPVTTDLGVDLRTPDQLEAVFEGVVARGMTVNVVEVTK